MMKYLQWPRVHRMTHTVLVPALMKMRGNRPFSILIFVFLFLFLVPFFPCHLILASFVHMRTFFFLALPRFSNHKIGDLDLDLLVDPHLHPHLHLNLHLKVNLDLDLHLLLLDLQEQKMTLDSLMMTRTFAPLFCL